MGGRQAKEIGHSPSARQVIAARNRVGGLADQIDSTVSSSRAGDASAAGVGAAKVILRGGTDVLDENELGKPSTSPDILKEMEKWHFIKSHEDDEVKKLVEKMQNQMAALIRMQADKDAAANNLFSDGRAAPMGLMSADELAATLLALREGISHADKNIGNQSRAAFLDEMAAYGIDEELAIKLAKTIKTPITVYEEMEDINIAR
jgi:hypothetical protein